jgi:hypothetical protein
MAGDRDIKLPDAFDRLLRREMSIEPSPAFLPRVRERIEREPTRRLWHWSPWMSGAAVAAALSALIAVGTMLNLHVAAPSTPDAPVLRAGDPIARPAAPPNVVQPLRAVPRDVVQPLRAVPERAIPAVDAPVVVIDQRQRVALATLFRMVGDGRLTEEKLAATGRTSMQPIRDQVAPVGVKPVELSPIAVGGVQQTEK